MKPSVNPPISSILAANVRYAITLYCVDQNCPSTPEHQLVRLPNPEEDMRAFWVKHFPEDSADQLAFTDDGLWADYEIGNGHVYVFATRVTL